MKTLSSLRKTCKEQGFKVKKQTLSYGIHLKFFYNGISNGCITFPKTKELNAIKEQFQGLLINGQKVYGLRVKQ
jgi:hypothetical protein